MPAIKVLYGHALDDLVREDQMFEAADLNNIGITDALVPGVTLNIPVSKKADLITERIAPLQKTLTVKAIAGQTWVDMVMQVLGDESRLFELCDFNGAGITDDLQASSEVICLSTVEPQKQRVVNTLSVRKPSSLYFNVGNPAPEGIEYWAIEIDFIVS